MIPVTRTEQRTDIPFFLVPGVLLLALVLAGFLILDSSSQAFTRLTLEQEASHLASGIAALFGPGPGPEASHGIMRMAQPEAQSDRLERLRDMSGFWLAEGRANGLERIAVWSSSAGFVWTSSGDSDFSGLTVPGHPSWTPLPWGDRVWHGPGDHTMIYLKPLMRAPGRRMMGNDAPSRDIFLVLAYTGGDILVQGFIRRIIIWSLALGVALILVALALLFRRNQKLQQDLGQREVLASTGAAARTLAHEIRTPLSVIRMQTAMLRERLDAEHHPALDRLDTQVFRMQGLAEGVGALVRNEGASLSSPGAEILVPLRLPEDMETVLNDGMWQGVHLAGPDMEGIRIGKEELVTLMDNLLRNARQADPDTPVHLSWKPVRKKRMSFLYMEIRDEAGGMPRRTARKAFQPWFTTRPTGMGLGLPLCRDLARKRGGDLVLRRVRKPRGTCFILTIPLEGDTSRE